MATSIELGCCAGNLYIGVSGPANHAASAVADRLIGDFRACEGGSRSVILDLGNAGHVDSTFAGWMLGLAKRMRSDGQDVLLAGCSEGCAHSLRSMHVLEIFPVTEMERPETRAIACDAGANVDKDALRRMADAHAELAALDEGNARVFGPIATMLRGQLAAMK